jgi:hypothetical protein
MLSQHPENISDLCEFHGTCTFHTNGGVVDENALVLGLAVNMENIEDTPNSLPVQPPLATQSDANADVRMVVVNGIVVGPNVCSFIL